MHWYFALSLKRRFTIFYWLGIIILLLAIQPLKNHTYTSVRNLGDSALASRRFDNAILEYDKLRLIKINNPEPAQLIDRVRLGQNDVLSLRDFYIARNDTEMIAKMDAATKTYAEPKIATESCQNLLEQNEAQLALVCITRTTATWPNYRDGWITESLVAKALGKSDLQLESQQRALHLDPTLSL